jgi:membrane protein implicated in regulation of membrane protease activity
MLVIAIAWIYVVGMAAIAEALSPQGTLLGAFFTFMLYGLLPLGLVLYVLGTPARKRALRQAEERERATAAAASATGAVASTHSADASARAADPDGGGHAAGRRAAGTSEREEA